MAKYATLARLLIETLLLPQKLCLLVQIIRESRPELVEQIVLGGGIDPLMSELGNASRTRSLSLAAVSRAMLRTSSLTG